MRLQSFLFLFRILTFRPTGSITHPCFCLAVLKPLPQIFLKSLWNLYLHLYWKISALLSVSYACHNLRKLFLMYIDVIHYSLVNWAINLLVCLKPWWALLLYRCAFPKLLIYCLPSSTQWYRVCKFCFLKLLFYCFTLSTSSDHACKCIVVQVKMMGWCCSLKFLIREEQFWDVLSILFHLYLCDEEWRSKIFILLYRVLLFQAVVLSAVVKFIRKRLNLYVHELSGFQWFLEKCLSCQTN